MKLNDKVYQFLKWMCISALPIIATLTSVILQVWHLTDEQTITAIVTTINAVASAIGGLIGISTVSYYLGKDNKDESSC